MTTPETGYDQGGSEEDEGTVVFELTKVEHLYSRGIMGRLKRNGEPIGLLYFKSEEEFDWIKRRIDGEFDIEIQQLNINKGER